MSGLASVTGVLSVFSLGFGLLLAWFAVHFRGQRALIAAFDAHVPITTAVAGHPMFLGLASACIIGAVILNHRLVVDPGLRLRVAIVVALVAAAAVVFSHWANTAPFTDLADSVRRS